MVSSSTFCRCRVALLPHCGCASHQPKIARLVQLDRRTYPRRCSEPVRDLFCLSRGVVRIVWSKTYIAEPFLTNLLFRNEPFLSRGSGDLCFEIGNYFFRVKTWATFQTVLLRIHSVLLHLSSKYLIVLYNILDLY